MQVRCMPIRVHDTNANTHCMHYVPGSDVRQAAWTLSRRAHTPWPRRAPQWPQGAPPWLPPEAHTAWSQRHTVQSHLHDSAPAIYMLCARNMYLVLSTVRCRFWCHTREQPISRAHNRRTTRVIHPYHKQYTNLGLPCGEGITHEHTYSVRINHSRQTNAAPHCALTFRP